MDDLISRTKALDILVTSPNFHTTLTRIEELPAVDAIPVEWMRDKMRGYASALKSTELKALVTVMQMWQKEQEAKT